MSETSESGSPRLRLGPQAYALAMREAGEKRLSQDHLERAISKLAGSGSATTPDADWRKAIDALNANIAHLRHVVVAALAPTDEEVAKEIERINQLAIEQTNATLKQLSLDLPETDTVMDELARRHEEIAQQVALDASRTEPEIERD